MNISKLLILFVAVLFTTLSAQVFQLEWDYPEAVTFVGDIDNDGINEFMIGDETNQFLFYDVPTKTLKFTYNLIEIASRQEDEMMITYSHHQDYNNNGSVDLWMTAGDFYPTIIIIDVVTGQELFRADSSFAGIVADIDNDQLLELVVYHIMGNFSGYQTLVYGTNVPVTGLIAENPTTQPKSFQLEQNYPNPFNPSTTIKWEQSHTANVEITIYDNLGRKIKTLMSERKPFGTHSVVWDGTNRQGKTVASGNYFYEVSFDGTKEARKMILLK